MYFIAHIHNNANRGGVRFMAYNVYIQQMIENFIKTLSKPVLVIKHYNVQQPSKSDFLKLLPNDTDASCVYHEYQPDSLYEAYEPFLDWIRLFYVNFYQDHMSLEHFLKTCHIYSLHREIFSSYIQTGTCTRTEEIMYTELNFERSNFFTDIIHIFEYIASEHKLVLILSAFHLAPLSSVSILLPILKKRIPNLYFILIYNDAYYPKPYIETEWNRLLSYIKETTIPLELDTFKSDTIMHSSEDYVFDTTHTFQNITHLYNMYHTLALEDLKYYIVDIYNKIEHNPSILPEEDAYKILKLYTLLSLCQDDTEAAILSCKLITNLSIYVTSPQVAYDYNYLSIKTQFSSGHMEIIRNSYLNCISIAEQYGDDFSVFRANLIYCMAQFGGWKDLFLCDFRIPIPYELVEQCKSYKFFNHLAYLYTMGFENDKDTIRAIAEGRENSVYFTKGVQLAKAIGNTDFLMLAYMKNIILYSDAGFHEYVYQMHKKRIDTVNSSDKVLQAHMFLGIGYNCTILEKYTKADYYFRNALHNLANECKADDCMDALYNISMNYFVVEDYEAVIPCIDILQKMLASLDYQHLMVCSSAKLYGMLALSYFHLQDYYNTHHFLGIMELNMSQFLEEDEETDYTYWEEELFLYHYIKALLYEHENNFTACQKELTLSHKFLWMLPGTIFYTYSLYTVAQANLYEKCGNLEARTALFENAITYYKREGFFQCAKKLIAIQNGNTPSKVVIPFNEPDLWFDKLLTLANYEGTKNKLKYREKDIAFLTIWQENLNRAESDINTLVENAITIMQKSYSLSDAIMLKQDKDTSCVLFNNSNISLSEHQMHNIFRFFRQYKRGFLTNRTDKNFLQFMPIIELFGKNRVVTMLGIPISNGDVEYVLLSHVNAQRNFKNNRTPLTDENLVTLKFAYSQLIDAIKQIKSNIMIRKMNETLERVSMTDYLTGLYNRHGLSDIIANKLSQMQGRTILILYIDLDNFKYYNDTFGHDIGDFLLVHFSNLFTSLVGKDGYTIRYGGDEFVMVLPDKTEAYGLDLSNQIFAQIQDGCKAAISEQLQKEIEIPENKRLSCSIGITEYSGTTQADIEHALTHADEALYFIKHNSKGHAITWSKLQDLPL